MSVQSVTDLRKFLAIGTGIGIEIRGGDLAVTMARLRPSGAAVLGATTIARFRERPAADWGGEYAEFLKRHGGSYLTATVLLPRREVIVRQLALPGVSSRDLDAAVRFQLDSMHPYPEDEAMAAWTRIGKSGTVLIGIARRPSIEQYISMFAEAGVKASSFTFSAAVLYSAIRMISNPPKDGFLGICETSDGLEAYGESGSRPLFSATLDLDPEKAAPLAASELRLPAEAEPVELLKLLPLPQAAPSDYDLSRSTLVYAAALAGACPRLALPVNLLPAAQRSSNSRAMFVPTAVLGVLLAAGLIVMGSISPIEDRRYLAALESEIARLEPQAKKAAGLDSAASAARARARLLDNFRLRSKADLDAAAELTKILEPPVWLGSLELTRDVAILGGDTDQGGPLLKIIDKSPMFKDSDFMVPLMRVNQREMFRIRTAREGSPE